MHIACIIPAYNEAKYITKVVTGVQPFVNEIIVVDDGSTDQTAVLARAAGATVLSHIINRGQGAALRTGTQYALNKGLDIIVHFDADDQFSAEEIPAVVGPLISGRAAAVLGSRFLGKKSRLPKLKKILLLPLARLVNRLLFNVRLTDPQSGFRALNRETAQKIKISSDGMAHCSEILYQLSKYKIPLLEVPITVRYHNYGQRFSGGLKIIGDLLIQKIIQ
jgi:glycosyltransferase involved in cell wall biosynthesis